ncbi:MAG: lyase family protein [Thermoplasmatales archaeon]
MSRIEKDSLGNVEIPDDRLYGPETARALANFPYKREMDKRIIDTLIGIKRSYVSAFMSVGTIPMDIGEAIIEAADLLLKDKNGDDFPLKYIQAGAGTSTNMNVNEVLANKALQILGKPLGRHEIISPHNHVNIGQSTNDVFPAAVRITLLFSIKEFLNHLKSVIDKLNAMAREHEASIKTGRTHLQDASAVTFGGEFKAYADELASFVVQAEFIMQRLRRINLGGTAVGTGANLPTNARKILYEKVNEHFKENFTPAENLMSVMQFTSDFNLVASFFSNLSASIIKIARDFRLMNSGPIAGFNEIVLPAVQPGSSIMPGKVNPSIFEAVTMSALYSRGLAQTVNEASTQGEMEINVFVPIIYTSLMEIIDVLTVSMDIMRDKTLEGIKVNKEYAYNVLINSPGTALLLNPVIGYEKTAELVKESKEKKVALPELLRQKKILPEEEIRRIFSVENMLNKG